MPWSFLLLQRCSDGRRSLHSACKQRQFALSSFRIIAVLIGLTLFPRVVVGKDNSATAQLDSIKKQRVHLAAELREASTKDGIESSDEAKANQGLVGLGALDSLLAQHEAKLNELLTLTQKRQEAKLLVERVEQFKPDEKKPYSFLIVESLKDEQEREELSEQSISLDLKSAKQRLDSARIALEDKQKATRSTEPKTSSSIEMPRTEVELDSALALTRIGLRKTESDVLQCQLDICKLMQEQLAAKLAVYEKGAKFSVEDREAKIFELKTAESTFQLQCTAAEQRVAFLVALQTRLSSDASSDLANELALRRVSYTLEMCQAIALESTLVSECLVDSQSQWLHRFELQNAGKDKKSDLKDWKSSLDDLLDRIDTYNVAFHRKHESMQSRTDSAIRETEMGNLSLDEKRSLLESQRFIDTALTKCFDQLQALKRPLVRFQKELRTVISKTTSIWSTNPADVVNAILAYELVEVDDEGIPVSRALLLTFLIALGIYGSVLVSKVIARLLFPYLGVKPGVAVALRSIVRYALCIVFGIVAFRLMGIPLTAFAFLGGAAAIAVGFGSQDVMNNFMSGVILLTEQPIRVGDVILLSENQCIVTHIGLRSTRLKNYQNNELIVPNTLLIEKLVTNLTLSDNLLRLVVPLVVDRTEPIKDSMQLVIQTLKKESRVHQAMEPIVLLKEVDTYYLTFEVHFTIEFADPMESLVAQSNILAVIGQLFPTKANTPVDAEETEEPPNDQNTQNTQNNQSEDPGKLTRDQLEKQIKKLQSFLIKKK